MVDMSRRELRRMLDTWPTVLRLATDPWAKEFAASIWRQSGQPAWMPTKRQLQTMRAMLRQLPPEGDDEIILIE